MRRSDYDLPSPPVADSSFPGRGWVRTPPAAPYGEVPREKTALSEPSAPHRGRRQRRKKGKARWGLRGLILFLALLLVLGGAALLLSRDRQKPSPSAQPSQGQNENDWAAKLDDTTAPRAPTGDGTVMTLAPLEGEALTAQGIYRKVNPSVVGVRAIQTTGASLGTGVILSSDGYIVTNAHVISGGRTLQVVYDSGAWQEALLVGYDADTDLAVLKVEAADLPAAVFGDSSQLQVGDTAYAIGNPLGEELRGTLTNGIISAIDRAVDMDGTEMTLIQTTAALNPGNSGGALINDRGQVVGITNMKMMSSYNTIEGLGFAIPTVSAKAVVDQIIEKGFYEGPGMLGVTVQDPPYDGDGPLGAYVVSVIPGCDAEKQGIKAGDVILSAGANVVTGVDGLLAAKEGISPGETLSLKVWRDGDIVTVTVTLMSEDALAELAAAAK